jgi:type IV pilus assembly protein PilB
MKKRKRLGDVLVEGGTLDEMSLMRALAIQERKKARLGEVLVRNPLVSKAEVAKAIEQLQGVPYVECPPASIAPEALRQIPRALAVKCCALPIEVQKNLLIVAVAEPQSLALMDELRFATKLSVSLRFCFRKDIMEGIAQYYDNGGVPLPQPAEPEEETETLTIEFTVAGRPSPSR